MSTRQSRPPLLLIADDEPVNLKLLVDGLRDDFRIRIATDGETALAIAGDEEPPDLILLDVMMPRLDGYEVCRLLKQQDATRDIPVIFVTGVSDEEGETHGLELGAVDYIAKPINLRITRARILTHLKLKQAQEHLAQLSQIDGLTEIANRRRFDEALHVEWRRNLRMGTPLAVLMADIDYFKQYNDMHGHLAGDDCLKRVALAFTGAMRRPTDLTARYGGEEFVALLADTDSEGAWRVADAMRRKVEQLMIAHGASSHPCVTVSCGIAVAVPSDNSSAEELVMRADRKLYEAKAAGRNRIAT
ncbi:MAG TPA: diguanylate cyclase [Casimicrobiaceae bacterium]